MGRKRHATDRHPETVAAVCDNIGYMDAVMKKIKAIDHANKVLQSKYNNNEKSVHLHKRICEENNRRNAAEPPEPPHLPHRDGYCHGSCRHQQDIDEEVYNDWHKMLSAGYFDQMVMHNLAIRLTSLKVAADHLWFQSRLATELPQKLQ